MNYLGIDYGKHKIGLARSEGQIAVPFKIVSTTSLKDSLEKISSIIDKEEINRVVIGIPESGESHKMAKTFFQELKNRYLGKPVEMTLADETLTSINARDFMREQGVAKSKRNEEDAYAASLILQNFLDSLQ